MISPSPKKRMIFFIISDIILSFFSLFMSYQLRFSFDVEDQYYIHFVLIFVVLTTLKIAFLGYFKIYKVVWRFFSLVEAKKLVYAHLLAYFSFFIIFVIFQSKFIPFPRSILIIDFFLSLIFIGTLRLLKRLILETNYNNLYKNTLIVGASSFAQTLIKDYKNYSVVAVVDDLSMVVGSYFSNIKVKSINDIEDILEQNSIESVIIAKDLGRSELNKLYKIFRKSNINDVKLVSLSSSDKKLKDLSVEDLLARKPKDLDKTAIENFIKNKTVLITGAGGSIGSELSRQCVRFGAKTLLLLDHSEYNLYKIEQELSSEDIVPVLQSVANKKILEKTFKKYDIDIVFHAAAYKHVPLVEENVEEAILNNIIGTKNCMDLAVKYGVKKFVMISTDKAVRPTNVMGTTKRVCELYGQNLDTKDTEIVSVRFGNVLGSSGSVIPKFQKQIEKGENITVTHPDITRYFMLIPEACQLVLQAGSIGRGGELFILDMGEPVKIVDLAKKMIELSGRDDIEIEFTGLRKGEKLYEELLINEADAKTKYDSIMIAKPTKYDLELLKRQIEELLKTDDKISVLRQIVPEFKHNSLK